jgi:hypothetical protein
MAPRYIVTCSDWAYGPFDDRVFAERIADQVIAEGDDGGYVIELREWRDEWTETIPERIARTRARRTRAR